MMPSAEPNFSDMLDGGCNWRNRSELLGVLMRWSPNTTGGSRFFVTKAEYPVSALDGRDGYGSDAEYLPRRPRSHIQISATGRSRHSRYPACPVRFKSGHSTAAGRVVSTSRAFLRAMRQP